MTIGESILSVFSERGRVLAAKEIKELVLEAFPDTNEGSIGPELKNLSDRGDLERVGYGKYIKPAKPREGPWARRSSTNSPQSYSYDTAVSYPVHDVGVGAGPGAVQERTEEYLMAPKSIVAGWTGGSLPKKNEAYWTKVRGTSMEPWLPDGSPILVVKCTEVIQGGRYVIYMDDMDAEVVKRVERIGGGVLRIISDNPGHSTQIVRAIPGEDDMYRDEEYGVSIRIRVTGVVVYPKDTGYAITRMLSSRG